eukprot:6203466-Pleurochrysis_carterae.AAC.2
MASRLRDSHYSRCHVLSRSSRAPGDASAAATQVRRRLRGRHKPFATSQPLVNVPVRSSHFDCSAFSARVFNGSREEWIRLATLGRTA